MADHLEDAGIRIVESNEDPLVYSSGHLPGAVEIDWTRDLKDQLRRDYVDVEGFGALLGRLGLSPETRVVFYGDQNNWGAKSVPRALAANEDGSFKAADELRAIYAEEQGLSSGDEIIAYCRIWERSSHTWFVLTHLLGFEKVRNYDGGWTEWGNRVGVPVERFRGVPPRLASRPYPQERLVPNCESEAYFWAEDREDGSLSFHFAVENPQGISAKAMAVILVETLSGAVLEQVLAVPSDILYEIFGRELSMGKSMGLLGMVGMAQLAARSRSAQRAGWS